MRTIRSCVGLLLIAVALIMPGLSLLMNISQTFAADALTISGTLVPEAYENESYSWQFSVSGGTTPYSCNITGLLPSWLTMNQATLTLTGKPPRGLSTDNVTFGIRIGDNSNPPLIMDNRISIPLRYHSNISVSSNLAGNQANLYIDGQQTDRLSGGGKIVKTFVSGTTHTVSVEPQVVGGGNDVRYSAVNDKISVNGLSPDAVFDYTAEYNVQVKSNVTSIPALLGSGWYKAGSVVNTTALSQYDSNPGVQYRFNFWQLPTGEVSGNPVLELKVAKQGEVVATYDTYYELTFNTPYCSVNGAGWYKAGSSAKWNMACAETIPSPDFWGSLGVELKPDKSKGTVIVDAPREIDIKWKPDYTKLVVAVTLGAIGAFATIFITVAHDKIRQLINRMRGGGY